jgi:hypothetical protein
MCLTPSEVSMCQAELSLLQAVEARRVLTRPGFHILCTLGSQMAVRSDLPTGLSLPLSQEDSSCSFLLETNSTPGR